MKFWTNSSWYYSPASLIENLLSAQQSDILIILYFLHCTIILLSQLPQVFATSLLQLSETFACKLNSQLDSCSLAVTILFLALKLAPWSANTSQASFCPQWTAACNGVQPSLSLALISTPSWNKRLKTKSITDYNDCLKNCFVKHGCFFSTG